MKNAISYFSIAAEDFERAKTFYEALYDQTFEVMEDNGDTMLMLPGDMENGGVAGAVTKGPNRKPSQDGTLVYLNFEGDLQEVLTRAEQAGGTIDTPKAPIPDMGFYGIIIDSEGNRIGVWSQN
jgi:predicted enzyme related to lactoylglutathione lyase